MIKLTGNAKATILLCSNLALGKDFKPLTAIQWYNLSVKIFNSSIKEPAYLFGLELREIQEKLSLSESDAQRIFSLLGRGVGMALELNKLADMGINVVTKSDAEYPKRLIRVLGGRYSPPVIYYAGNLSLVNTDGIAIVGSRNIDANGGICAETLARKAALAKMTVYSGGARGVDSISRHISISEGGTCVEILSDSMSKKLMQKEYIEPIMQNRLLLLSVTNPTSGFSVGAAMNRNKYIYALSRKAFVIASDYQKGGTWTGAIECMKKKMVPVYVWNNLDYKGNKALIEEGAYSFCDVAKVDLSSTSNNELENNVMKSSMGDLFSNLADNIDAHGKEENDGIYLAVLPILKKYLYKEHTFAEISNKFNVLDEQLRIWIQRAVRDKQIKELNSPLRYIAEN